MSNNYNSTLQSNNTDLQAILNTINELPEAGGSDPVLQDKTVTPTTSRQSITADSGYDGLDTVTVNAMPTATQATPAITVNASGLITATATQTAGYVAAGSKSATKQLAFQAAKTITPSTTSQIAVSSGYYTGGDITVAGDSNLVANNIVSGKTIFGVAGTATVGDDPFASATSFTYTVNAISNAQYGFAKNSNGYYESQNKGQNSSYAICRVNLTVTKTCDIIFDVINYAEGGYDYALFGDLNKALLLSNTADSSNVKKNFKGQQSASIVNVTYSGVTAGSHYIDIKFIKDGTQHSNNDSVQFKLQEQSGLSQETINKILAADKDLVAENIKSGVNIFGVNGTYGDTSIEDSLVTKVVSNYMNDRVTTIGSYAFIYCTELTTVSFPAATTISGHAFYQCSKLTTISFPNVTYIGSYAFKSCSQLTAVSFPAATNIGAYDFADCYKLTTINFPVATSIGSNAFYNCSSLTTISFPKAKYIDSYAFVNCNNLTTFSFPEVSIINIYAFSNCNKLTTASFSKVTNIGSNAFCGCSSLTTISFPSAKTIGSYAFAYCTELTTVSFPAATTIGSNAFYGCYSLTTASFPSATTISSYAFTRCSNLKSLYPTGSSVCTLANSNAFSSTPIGGYSAFAGTYGSIYVPTSLLTSYKTATNWTYFSSRFVGI